MAYTIGEIAAMTGLTISTLRFYEKNGLLPEVQRTTGNIRIYDDGDLRRIHMIECMKRTGMPLKDIRIFFEWCQEGDSTIDQRYAMLLARKEETERQIAQLQETLDNINRKCEFYRKAHAAGTTRFRRGS